MTLANTGQFKKFFHYQIAEETLYVTIAGLTAVM